MGHPERDLINEKLLSLPDNERLFRCNSGFGWTGTSIKKGDILIIKNPRPFRGMPPGWPDLCGWRTVEITPDMVGKRVAVFYAVEVKATGRLSKIQKSMQILIEKMGGIFEIINEKKS
jgi:hypothetical protein